MFHHFAFIDDPDDFLGIVGNDLFEQQGSAAAFDPLEIFADFIGSVHCDVDASNFIHTLQRNP